MRLQIISDLHQEFGFKDLAFDNADVAIFAGDVNIGIKGVEWLLNKFPKTPVVYVLGNQLISGTLFMKLRLLKKCN